MAYTAADVVNFEQQPLQLGAGVMLSSICFFISLNVIVSFTGAPKCVKADFWKWRNLLISWIHALIVGIWDLLCFYYHPEMWADLIFYHTPFIYFMVAFSTGYFIYDFFDIVYTGRFFSSWEVVIHHIVVAGIFFYNVVTCKCIAYNVLALMAEINSMFLHSRKLLQMGGVDFHHPVYRLNVHLNLITFVVGRFGGLLAISYGMYYWRDQVTLSYYLALSTSMFVMTAINTVLFWRLLKNDILRAGTHPKPSTAHANNNIKENGVVYENGCAKIQSKQD